MGIYPVTTIEDRRILSDGTETWVQVETTPGLRRARLVTTGGWSEVRTDCFCCSCDEDGGGDAYCRNHGHAGERPCELHGFGGSADEDGVMPSSVQAYRRAHA